MKIEDCPLICQVLDQAFPFHDYIHILFLTSAIDISFLEVTVVYALTILHKNVTQVPPELCFHSHSDTAESYEATCSKAFQASFSLNF